MAWRGSTFTSLLVLLVQRTAADPTTPSPSSKCFDKENACESWAEAGECEKNKAFMHDSCPEACMICTPPPPIDDRDQHHRHNSHHAPLGLSSSGSQNTSRTQVKSFQTACRFCWTAR